MRELSTSEIIDVTGGLTLHPFVERAVKVAVWVAKKVIDASRQ